MCLDDTVPKPSSRDQASSLSGRGPTLELFALGPAAWS